MLREEKVASCFPIMHRERSWGQVLHSVEGHSAIIPCLSLREARWGTVSVGHFTGCLALNSLDRDASCLLELSRKTSHSVPGKHKACGKIKPQGWGRKPVFHGRLERKFLFHKGLSWHQDLTLREEDISVLVSSLSKKLRVSLGFFVVFIFRTLCSWYHIWWHIGIFKNCNDGQCGRLYFPRRPQKIFHIQVFCTVWRGHSHHQELLSLHLHKFVATVKVILCDFWS